ncbi:glycosyltransferase [Cohnella sp. CFH 77786]|uniref:glycosyltransferase n=1 Tax=Cohnella sp. CFH 77786 TaxID=2662265 RepID=UPI001C60EFA7|nr:glycosyltransferase [Cohnella sp. CFH 77786]MBW5447400.1 glycosyltransferase [Cohnella sp. CFH 77786]
MSLPDSPLVSVVVPFYNCPFIDQCLESILGQTYPHIEIVVVDDGSERHLKKLEPYLDRIRCVRKPNGGTSSALNRGIRAAQGEYIAWLSSDDIMLPRKIETQVAYMQHHDALICCTNYHYINEDNDIVSEDRSALFPSAYQFIEGFLHFCPVNGSTVMMHRKLPPFIGWFDESLRGPQDYEYWIRVLLARVDFHFLNESLTLYRWHDGMGTLRMKERNEREFIQVRDRYAPRLKALLSLLPST